MQDAVFNFAFRLRCLSDASSMGGALKYIGAILALVVPSLFKNLKV